MDIVDAAGRDRYEATLDGRPVGLLEYVRTSELVTLTYAEVVPEVEGRGVGGALARFALGDARSRHLSVLPRCRFVRGYLARHPEYADLTYRAALRNRGR